MMPDHAQELTVPLAKDHAATADGHLVVIDMQRVFADSSSPWAAPGFQDIIPRIDRLVRAYRERVVFTRFVPPRRVRRAWHEYYAQWSFALSPEANELWNLVTPWLGLPTVDCATLSKWKGLKSAIPRATHITLCGVSTDCCVLSTAYAAIDDGVKVYVVADACTASPASHRAALEVMGKRAPLITLTTVQRHLGENVDASA
jgi:nicotinamidase-related amidase